MRTGNLRNSGVAAVSRAVSVSKREAWRPIDGDFEATLSSSDADLGWCAGGPLTPFGGVGKAHVTNRRLPGSKPAGRSIGESN